MQAGKSSSQRMSKTEAKSPGRKANASNSMASNKTQQDRFLNDTMKHSYNRMTILEAQVQKLQEKVSENASSQVKLQHLASLQDREKEEWEESKKLLEEQLARSRQECATLKRVVNSRSGEKEGSDEMWTNHLMQRSLSSQSLPAHVSASRDLAPPDSSPPASVQNYPLHTQIKPTCPPPLANSTLLGHSLVSGSSTSSLSSIKSTNRSSTISTRRRITSDCSFHPPQSRYYSPFSSTPRYPTTTRQPSNLYYVGEAENPGVKFTLSSKNGYSDRIVRPHYSSSGDVVLSSSTATKSSTLTSPPDVELQRSKLKIKQLQKEVTLLEQQLSDKTRSARGHVEELVLLRTELAQEKASLAIVRQEVRDQAKREWGIAQSAHAQKVQEVESKLKKEEEEKEKLKVELGEMRIQMKGVEVEKSRLDEKVVELESLLSGEKILHSRAMSDLNAEIESGCTRVSQLERELSQCKMELEGHVTRVKEDTANHQAQVWQMRRQVEMISKELKQKENESVRKSELNSILQQELESMKAEFQRGHTSWESAKKQLNNKLSQSEVDREALLVQLTETSRKLSLSTAKMKEQEEMQAELERHGLEIQRLKGAVKRECSNRERTEMEKEMWEMEAGKMEGRYKEVQAQQQQMEKRWKEEIERKEACEQEGEELREEVARLSKELRACQHQLQGEIEHRTEKERNEQDSLLHLQQELAKRAQQVLEMDRLLQSHQAETTARRLQLERSLSQKQGELSARTQEVEELTVHRNEDSATIKELREQLAQLKEDNMNMFSGSQAQLLSKNSELAGLERKLRKAESTVEAKLKELVKLRNDKDLYEQKEREGLVSMMELQEKVKLLTKQNESLHSNHLIEIQHLQEIHASQLLSREQQADTHRLQLQEIAQQEKARQEELSRCRIQVTSLSAELSAERRVTEETRQQAVIAKAEAARYRAQVSELSKTVSALNSQQQNTVVTTPMQCHVMDGNQMNDHMDGFPNISMETNSLSSLERSTDDIEFATLPNHLRLTPPSVPPTNAPIPAKGGIISI